MFPNERDSEMVNIIVVLVPGVDTMGIHCSHERTVTPVLSAAL